MPVTSSKPGVFISYSHRDRDLAAEVENAIKTAGFEVWRDDRTRRTPNWSQGIARELAERDVVVLLWSRNAHESEWVNSEWITARALGKGIIPCVLASDTDKDKGHDLPAELGDFASIDLYPGKKQPAGITQIVELLRRPDSIPRGWQYSRHPARFYVPFPPNPDFVGRKQQLLELYLDLFGAVNPVGINQSNGTFGMGGIGKTRLAAEFCHRFAPAFKDGVIWVNAADRRGWLGQFALSAAGFGIVPVAKPDLDQDAAQVLGLQGYLSQHPNALLVLDNVARPQEVNTELISGFNPSTLGCSLLVTTRSRDLPTGMKQLRVDKLPPEDAFDLLTIASAPAGEAEGNAAKNICERLGYLPLGVEVAGKYQASKKNGVGYRHYFNDQRERIKTIEQYGKERPLATHRPALLATLQIQYKLVEDPTARLLFQIPGQMAEAAVIPRGRLSLFSGVAEPGSGDRNLLLSDAIDELTGLSLAEKLKNDTVRLHPLVREFARSLVPDPAEFCRRCADRLHAAYEDIGRVEAESTERDVDSVIEDLRIALAWAGKDDYRRRDLDELLRVLDKERHNLRRLPGEPEEPGLSLRLAQQVLYRSHRVGFTRLAERARASLLYSGRPWLEPVGPGQQEDPALIRVFRGHSGPVYAVALSRDGKFALSGSSDKTLILWDFESGRPVRTLKGHSDWVNAVALSGDGRFALSGSSDKTLILWDFESGSQVRTFKGHSGAVNAVALSGDGRFALSGSDDDTLILWDTESGRQVRTFGGHSGSVNAVALSQDGKFALSRSLDNTLILWDTETGTQVRTFRGHFAWVYAVALSPDGKFALSGSWDSTLILWDTESGRQVRTFEGHSGWLSAVALSQDGKTALSSSNDDTLILWDTESGSQVRTFSGHSGAVNAVALSQDEKTALSGSCDKTLILWDTESGRQVRTFGGHARAVGAVALSGDGKFALSGSDDTTLILWDFESGRQVRTFKGHSGAVSAVALSRDGRFALSGSGDHTLILWNTDTGRQVRTFRGHSGWVRAVALSGDGKFALSGSDDDTLILWDIESGRHVRTFKGHSGWVSTVALSQNGRSALSGSGDKTLILWDTESGRQVRTFKGHSDWVSAVALSRDGKFALSGSHDKTLIRWDTESGRQVCTVNGHSGAVSAVALSRDGKFALSGSGDETLILWDTESGEPVLRLALPSSLCAVSWQGNDIAVGLSSGEVCFFKVWPAARAVSTERSRTSSYLPRTPFHVGASQQPMELFVAQKQVALDSIRKAGGSLDDPDRRQVHTALMVSLFESMAVEFRGSAYTALILSLMAEAVQSIGAGNTTPREYEALYALLEKKVILRMTKEQAAECLDAMEKAGFKVLPSYEAMKDYLAYLEKREDPQWMAEREGMYVCFAVGREVGFNRDETTLLAQLPPKYDSVPRFIDRVSLHEEEEVIDMPSDVTCEDA